jgi:hypothetical protein
MIYKSPLFEVPVFKMKASRHADIKTWMLENVYPVFEKNGPNEVVRNLYSSYFPGSPKIDNAVFSELYARDIIKFLDKIGLSKKDRWGTKLNFWYNLSTKGAHQEVHDHLGGPVSISYAAIHYVLFDKEEHTSAVFYNPLTQILKCTQPATTDQLKLPDYSEFQKLLDVEEGDLIIFPSYVLHSVMTQLSEKLRITTAFNICIYDKTCHE